jgi:hypothetical protein
MRDAAAAGEDTSSQKFVTDLATWVNRSSGRGTLPEAMESADKLLAGTFFAPRLTASRVQVFTHVLAYEPFVRKQAIKGLLGTLGAVGTISGLSVLAGGKVSLDPTNTDFLKVRFGNTRFDFLGGHQQIFRMLAQMVTGKVTSSTTGKMMDLNAPGAKMNRADIALRFLESKMSPAASFVLTALSGKDYIGRPVSIPNEVLVRLTPLIVNDISDALQEYHGLHGPAIAVAPLALVGIGTQTYEPTLPKSVAGPQQPQWGPAMQLYRHLTGEDQIATLKLLTPQRANDYAKDAALANTLGQAEATRVPGFAKLPKETQTKVINKMVERRMKPLRTLWATRLGQHGEQARLRAEASFDRQRANILK